ncbi:hypothetical protein SODALDRAFT_377462 [Sodiomyces alkalinus F11]|uniref:Nudix hydrolase domain-containing protein n=1 Tax=Sodiomyces alkalinus (strain CBS 110278 / VKM F-3762 / F11) TaxID=1314773 RepID=A0A3N2PYD1_SODAK|nr:hypothetical protein SODALDRAFT_377462 [Sodiomyces alkalinus F11]ROT39507.1 hypothetical protein SODALDRAFT_377462 [Sodiomyces alkalinus F11]
MNRINPSELESQDLNPRDIPLIAHPNTVTERTTSLFTAPSAQPNHAKRPVPEPRPSSSFFSIVLLSPTNQVLLLHRVKTSKSFASAHVFPGGNLDSYQDGTIPPADSLERHQDGPAYRLGAIRECFEESGILLATRKNATKKDDVSSTANANADADDRVLVSLSPTERDAARKRIHANEVRFADWVASVGGAPDLDGLIPFTRWVTPTNVARRFTTQMYLYLIPDVSLSPSSSSSSSSSSTAAEAARQREIIVATPDGGVEHTAARFDDAAEWIAQADRGEIILFPPQYYLLRLVARFCTGGGGGGDAASPAGFAAQRERLCAFLNKVPASSSEKGVGQPTARIPWSEKVMSPHTLFIRKGDGRIVLGLDKPGPELKDSGRGGDWDHVVVVRFAKDGPREVEVRGREDVLKEEREAGHGEASPPTRLRALHRRSPAYIIGSISHYRPIGVHIVASLSPTPRGVFGGAAYLYCYTPVPSDEHKQK